MMRLNAEEMSLLRLADTYGDGFDLTGDRVPRRTKDVARALINAGLLASKNSRLKGLWVTQKGHEALQQEKPQS